MLLFYKCISNVMVCTPIKILSKQGDGTMVINTACRRCVRRFDGRRPTVTRRSVLLIAYVAQLCLPSNFRLSTENNHCYYSFKLETVLDFKMYIY